MSVFPGLPTTAEFFIIPEKRSTAGTQEGKGTHLDQVLYLHCQLLETPCFFFSTLFGRYIQSTKKDSIPKHFFFSSFVFKYVFERK